MGRPTEDRPRFQTGPGKSGRPGLSGGLGKRGHGGNVIPSRNRKGENGNPPPISRRARVLSQPGAGRANEPRKSPSSWGRRRGTRRKATPYASLVLSNVIP